MANRATRRVSDDNHSTFQTTVTDDPRLAVVFASVFDLHSRPFENRQRIFKVETALRKSPVSLGWIERQTHADNVSTKTWSGKGVRESGRADRKVLGLVGLLPPGSSHNPAMYSKRFDRPVIVTRHAAWLSVPGRDDNMVCAVLVLEEAVIVKTVMHHWELMP